jgi:pyrimidine-nucleoside phosphorylase
MNIRTILEKKRDGKELRKEEIQYLIDGIDDYTTDIHLSAFLMASFIQGLNTKETAALTEAMLHSGTVLDFNSTTIDKHSTGGVGDKTSFILAPIVASCGISVPMISGRGLGHTGGTLDKLESIKGFSISLSKEEFKKQVEDIGIAIVGQNDSIAPADGKIYSIRDVTSTVSSIPLITASIMSKKLAAGLNGLVLDVKVGNGAFMETIEDATILAESMVAVGNNCGKKMSAFITDMNQPLGYNIGNSLEILEAIKTLEGNGPEDLTELSCQLAGKMIELSGKCSFSDGYSLAREKITNGEALAKFKEMIKAQNGDIDSITVAPSKTEIFSDAAGFLTGFSTKKLGMALISLGGGRNKVTDSIDHNVGIILNKKIGDNVACGELLATVYHNKEQNIKEALDLIEISVGEKKLESVLIKKII